MSDNNTPVDPRIQIELEKLNSATDNINKFEVELDEAKSDFKKLLVESVERIKQSAHKLGNSIQTAKPYYEARLYASQLAKDTQEAAIKYEKAKSIHSAAKEMVYLAEQGLGEKSTLDTACQEMLSHAASRVNQSQIETTDTRNMLKISELKQEVANNRVAKLQAQLKSAIRASRPYYETRANYNGLLKEHKKRIADLEAKVSEAKLTYNEALKNLEQISEEIHKMREEKNRLLMKTNELMNNTHNNKIISDNIDDLIYNNHKVNTNDEYLDIPSTLTLKSSPIRQKYFEKNECPHLLSELATTANSGSSNPNDDIEQWTDICLTNSESTSSGYSQHNSIIDDNQVLTPGQDLSVTSSSTTPTTSTDDDDGNKKVTCTVFNINDSNEDDKKEKNIANNEGISNWITKTNSGRRQSFDILIDAGDRVKDVFTLGIQKVGKSLERRNSESEVNTSSNDFFLFSRSDKEALSDEQVENLLLNEDGTDNQNVLNISK